MHLVSSVVVLLVLLAFPFGKMFVVHPSQEVKNGSRGELEIKKILLESLNLQQEPRVSTSRMDHLREPWKNTVRSSPAGNSTLLEDFGNSTCCKLSTQVFMKDLGWDRWVVHPESVAFVQCKPCGSASTGTSLQCCKPTAHELVPFIYVDEWSALVLSTVSLARECGCDPAEETLDPEIMSPP